MAKNKKQKKKVNNTSNPTQQKIKKLKTRAEMEAFKAKLPADYRVISERNFSDFTEITPNLYLTGIFGLTQENFEENKITNVINISFEAPDIVLKDVSYLRVSVDDDPVEDLTQYFDIIADNIEKEAKKGGRTVVHCVAGVSRSTSGVLAYLIKYNKMTLKDAFNYVMDRRSVIKPNSAFFEQLVKYEKAIRGQNSIKMIVGSKDGVSVKVPDFYLTEYKKLFDLDIETEKQRLAAESNGQQITSGLPTTAQAMVTAQQNQTLTANTNNVSSQSSITNSSNSSVSVADDKKSKKNPNKKKKS